jgi:Fe2+ transport system protein FeoA
MMAENIATLQTLDTLKPGEKAFIREFVDQNKTVGYLTELGLLIGTYVELIKFAPLGDPLEICFRGYHLSIRRSIARQILVEKENS